MLILFKNKKGYYKLSNHQFDNKEFLKKIFGDNFNFENHEVTKNSPNRDRVKNALDKAWECRDFEIKMYWHRAAYFWAFISIIAAGFSYVSFKRYEQNWIAPKNTTLLFISGLGIVFSFAWVLVNIGSKFWQDTWEKAIYTLEPEYYGEIYKESGRFNQCYSSWDAKRFSVSKINLFLSIFVLVVWTFLFLYVSFTISLTKLCGSFSFSCVNIFIIISVLITCVWLSCFSLSKVKKNC